MATMTQDPPQSPHETGSRAYLSAGEASELLGISDAHMARLLKEGVISWEKNPIDRRGKILRRAEVEQFAARLPQKKAVA